jgi:hypothetical protein
MAAKRLADTDETEGCTDHEIEDLIRFAEPFRLPDEYLAFLTVLGRNRGKFFPGTWISYPTPLTLRPDVEEVAADPTEYLTTDGRFFFGHHQGYKFYFFQEGSPAVFHYQEKHPDVEKLADSFLQWLWQVLERTR